MHLTTPDPKPFLRDDIAQALEQEFKKQDDEIDVAQAALLLAWADQPDLSLERYERHLQKLSDQACILYEGLLETESDSAALRLQVLRAVLCDQEGYSGDVETYDDVQNVSLIRVIERRKGLPIMLSILCLHMGRAQGWDVHALMVPGHVLCRVDFEGDRLIFDAFDQCKIMLAHDLRALVKKVYGPEAELSADHSEPALNRAILIRLQNNIKYRRIDAEDYEGALLTVQLMRMIDSQEYRLLLDAGVLYARVGQSMAAIHALEDYIRRAPDNQDRYEARLLLEDLKTMLN